MPPRLAALLTILFIYFLFWVDFKKKPIGVSKGILIPIIWILFAGTKSLWQWLNLKSNMLPTSEVYLEGNPLDRNVFLLFIIIGFIILIKRKIKWGLLFKKNIFIFLYFFFGLISVLWSDYPVVSFKRLIKAMGNVIVVLIILTEKRPDEALGVVFRSIAYIALPLSVLFIKYYPELGISYFWGRPMYQGITNHKNSLGKICLMPFIYFIWNILYNKFKRFEYDVHRVNPFIYITILPILLWLLYKASSATSLICAFIAIFILIFCRLPISRRNPVKIFNYGVIILIIFVGLELAFGLSNLIISLLGRNPSLTTRVPMWFDLLKMVKNPIIGAGYESFWLGNRLEAVWKNWGILHQAHNGYLETYLNLGLIGLILLISQIVFGFLKIRKNLAQYYSLSILKLTFIIIVIIYNWTEASFFGINNIWILMFLSILDISDQHKKTCTNVADSQILGNN